MRSLLILSAFIIAAVPFEGCGDSSLIFRDSKGKIYLNRITSLNRANQNDCTLDRCDERRLDRWRFEEVRGLVINDSTIHVGVGIDGLFVLMNCKEDLSKYDPYEEVIFTAVGRDACGYYEQNFCCDIGLFLEIYKIRKF